VKGNINIMNVLIFLLLLPIYVVNLDCKNEARFEWINANACLVFTHSKYLITMCEKALREKQEYAFNKKTTTGV
jgi:hypothetical protein